MQWTLALVLIAAAAAIAEQTPEHPLSTGLRIIRKIYDHCEHSEEIVKCLKQQAVKVTDRAIKMPSIPVISGLNLVKTETKENARSYNKYDNISDEQVKKMSSEELDQVLVEKSARFLNTHQMSFTMSSVLDKAAEGESIGRMIEEGRGKLKKYMGPILTAIAIKGGFVAMAFQAIALIAGKALLIGKIALVLSAIIGLKKLVSGGEAHEKTTYEIVKHPQVSQSHTYSSSHFGGGEYEASAGGGHYRRSLDADHAQNSAYSAHAPRH